MITISVCMIVKDEEETLDRVLTSIQNVVDEIIIVDTGSTDKTKEIASTYTDKVYDFEWCDDFSKARNYSFSKATMDYCMWLDADDILPKESQEALIALKETLEPDTSVIMMPYQVSFDAQGKPTFTYYRERIVKRNENFKWQGFIHEAITPGGKIKHVDIPVHHKKVKQGDGNRNLRIFESKIAEGVVLNPRELFYYARELYYHERYQDALDVFQQFLDTHQGWIENCISAYQIMAYCHNQLGDKKAAIQTLLLSFTLTTPRAEICCDLGKYHFELEDYNSAIFWYKAALLCTRDDSNGAFVLVDSYDFIPYIELCVCYYRIQDYQASYSYNELAGQCKPDHASYISNKKFLEPLITKED